MRHTPSLFLVVVLFIAAASLVAALDVPSGVPGEVVYVSFPVVTGSEGMPAD